MAGSVIIGQRKPHFKFYLFRRKG